MTKKNIKKFSRESKFVQQKLLDKLNKTTQPHVIKIKHICYKITMMINQVTSGLEL